MELNVNQKLFRISGIINDLQKNNTKKDNFVSFDDIIVINILRGGAFNVSNPQYCYVSGCTSFV